jgi:lipid II:glycine glycyltransferase (peptidoglycan interpeptide bridge formation enzyme)
VISDAAYSIKLDTDFDTIFSRFSRSRRTAYRSGIKQGVQIRLATSIDEYQAYYTNYRDAVERWGEDDGYGYKWNLFEQIYYLSKIYPENIKLWLMIVDQQIVGGRLIVYWNQQASLWNGTAHRDFLHYDVMPVADTEIIRDAIIRGYGSFDFNTSGENTGVITYKQRFGSSETPLTGWIYENPLVASARAAYQRLRNGLSPTDGVIASGVVIAILQGI